MPAGRPSKYSPELCEQAYKLYLLKATDEEVADFFGIHVDTLHEWRKVHEEFSEATTRGKLQADAEVAEKLRERALGYSHKAVKIFMPAGATEPVYAEYTEHYPPDTQAASLWLRNRQPEKWRDKQDHEHTGKDGGPIQTEEVSPNDLARRIAYAMMQGITQRPGDRRTAEESDASQAAGNRTSSSST